MLAKLSAIIERDTNNPARLTLWNRDDRLGLLMIRRLIGLVFVLFVAVDSIAATTFLNNGECIARCCRPAVQSLQSVNTSRVRCYSECDERGQSTPVLKKALIGSEYIFKADATVSASVSLQTEQRWSRTLQCSDHPCLYSNSVYLRTGSLLI